jgi:tetratricopeptide (TPR) repeat protein
MSEITTKAQSYFDFAQSLYQDKKYSKAIEYFEQCLKEDSNFPLANYYLGQIYENGFITI